MNTERAGDEPEDSDWWAAAIASEDPEYLAAFWFQRAENIVTFGSKWFDADLNPLDGASDAVALEVRLIRDPDEAVCRARCEIRTKLAFSTDGFAAKAQHLVETIAAAQRELVDRAGVSFTPPSGAKPHVLTAGRGLLRAYGKRSVFSLQKTAQGLLQAYSLLLRVWRAALTDSGSATIARVRMIAEHAIAADNNPDIRGLFAAPGDTAAAAEGRPEVTDDLLIRVGLAVGCLRMPDGRYAKPAEEITIGHQPPRGLVRMVAEDVATANELEVDSVRRKVLLPMLRGELNGPIIECTDAQAATYRAAMNGRQVAPPSRAEN